MSYRTKILSIALLLGVVVWIVDAELHAYMPPFMFERGSLMDMIMRHNLFIRFLVIAVLLIFSNYIARYVSRLQTATTQLEETTNELEAVFDSTSDGFCVIGKDNKIIRINDSLKKQFSLDGSTIIGSHCHCLLHSNNCDTPDCSLNLILEGRELLEYDVMTPESDGAKRVFQVTATPLFNSKRERIGMVKNYRDVTEPRTMQQQLRQRMLLEEMVTGLATSFLNSPEESVQGLMDNALKEIGSLCGVDRCYLFGFTDDLSAMSNTHEWCAEGIEPEIDNLQDIPSETLPWWMRKLIRLETIYIPRIADMPPEAAAERELLASQNIKSLLVIPLVYQHRLRGFMGLDAVRGEKEWSFEDQRILYMIGELISAAYLREEYERNLSALAESRAELERIINSSPVLAFRLKNEEGYPVDFVSDNADLFGLPSDDNIDKDYCHLDLIHPADRVYVVSMLKNLAESGEEDSIEQEYRLIDRAGNIQWVNRRIWAIRNERGETTHFQGVSLNISERKIAEEQLEKFVRELADKNRELEDFAYIVSHDLKAPLRAIGTLSDWIADDYSEQLDREGREQLALLRQRVKRMHDLIEGVLKYSRVGRMKEELVEVDLAETVNDVIELLAPPENITIEVSSALPLIKAERTRMKQVFENLISNAVKFMDKPDGRIRIFTEDSDDSLVVCVEDNGPGIEEKHFERIFKIFQTLSSRDSFESTGVGLTLVKKIATMYGGRIWLESEPGKGSVFKIAFPGSMIVKHPERAAV